MCAGLRGYAPILGVNAIATITIWNQKAALLSGYTKEDTFGKNLVNDFIIDSFKEKVQTVLSSAIAGTATSNYEVPLVTKDGQILDLVLNAAPRQDLSGDITGVVCIGQDVTFLKRLGLLNIKIVCSSNRTPIGVVKS